MGEKETGTATEEGERRQHGPGPVTPVGNGDTHRVGNEAYIDDASGATEMKKGTVKFFNEKEAAGGGGNNG